MTDLSVFFEGKRLCSAEPLPEAQRKINAIPLTDHTLYVLCSPLHAAGIEGLIDRLPANSHIVTVEFAPPLTLLLLDRVKAGFLSIPLKLIIPDTFVRISSKKQASEKDLVDYARELTSCFKKGIRRLYFFSIHGGRRIHSDQYVRLEQLCKEELQRYWRNLSTTLFMGTNWIRNSFSNIARHLDKNTPLPNLDQEDLVVVGAGPSLDHSINFLLSTPGKYKIMAVDTAVSALTGNGIYPDFVVVLESQPANLGDFIGVNLHQIHILADLSSDTSFLSTHTPRAISFFVSEFYDCKWWPVLEKLEKDTGHHLPHIHSAGSVGLVSLLLAGLMKPRRMYVAGLDFCFERGKSHARGCPALVTTLIKNTRFSGFPATGLLQREYPLLAEKKDFAACKSIASRPELFTTDVLQSYGSDAVELLNILQQKGLEIFDLRPWGFDLKILPCNASPSRNTDITDRSCISLNKKIMIPVDNTKKTRIFFEEILLKIDQCIGLIEKNTDINNINNITLIKDSLEQIDFLLLKIPPHRRNGTGYLIQAKLELWYYRRFIERKMKLFFPGLEDR